jgi:hypothetical protein
MNDLQDRLTSDLAELARRGPASGITTSHVLGRVQQRRRRRTTVRGVAACAVVAGVAIGIAAIVGRNTANTVGVQPNSSFVAATAPPLIALDASGWRVERFDDSSQPPALAIYVDARLGFAGPWFVIENATTQQVSKRAVDVGGGVGSIDGEGGFRVLVWTTVDGRQYQAMSRDVPENQLIAAAAGLLVDAGGTTTTSAVPAGMTLADASANQFLNRYAEYQLTNVAANLQVSFYSGARLESRTAGETRETIEFNGRTASLLDYATEGSPGTYRLDFVDGFWVWELNGDGFADRDSFLDLASKVAVVDEATWKATLPPDTITDSERPAAVDALLAGIPLPPVFDAGSIYIGSTKDPYQLSADVTGAVFCAWLHEWDAALDSGDTVAADAAVQAIASSRQWPALTAMTGGDWNTFLWEQADRVVSGDRSVVSAAVGGIGCV